MHDTFVQDVFKKNALDNKFPIRDDNDEPARRPAPTPVRRPAPSPPQLRKLATDGWDTEHQEIFTQMQTNVAMLLTALRLDNPESGENYLTALDARIQELEENHAEVTTQTGQEFEGIKQDLFQTQKAHEDHVENLNALNVQLQKLQQSHDGLKKTHDALNGKVNTLVKFAEGDKAKKDATTYPTNDEILLLDTKGKIRQAKYKMNQNIPMLFIPVRTPQDNPEHYYRGFQLIDGTFKVDMSGLYNNPGDHFNSNPIDQNTMNKILEVDLYQKYLKTEGAVPLQVSVLQPPTAPEPDAGNPKVNNPKINPVPGAFTYMDDNMDLFFALPIIPDNDDNNFLVYALEPKRSGAQDGYKPPKPGTLSKIDNIADLNPYDGGDQVADAMQDVYLYKQYMDAQEQ